MKSELISFLPTLPIIFLAYLILLTLLNRINKNIKEARGEEVSKNYEKERKAYEKINKYANKKLNKNKKIKGVVDKREEKLKRLGRPYNITSLIYYIYKFIIITFMFMVILISRKFSVLMIALGAFLFFYIDLKFYMKNKNDEKEISKELPKIYNLLEVMTYADIPFEKAIIEMESMTKNKRLKKAFLELSAEITTKKNISEALTKFQSKFDMNEINSFCLTIDQGLETGKIREMLSNQRQVLYKRYLNNKDLETSNSTFQVTIAMLLMFGSIGTITIFSFIKMLSSGLEFIFK